MKKPKSQEQEKVEQVSAALDGKKIVKKVIIHAFRTRPIRFYEDENGVTMDQAINRPKHLGTVIAVCDPEDADIIFDRVIEGRGL